jgi:hypothetical protein
MFITLMIEAAVTYETLAHIYQTTCHNNPENNYLHISSDFGYIPSIICVRSNQISQNLLSVLDVYYSLTTNHIASFKSLMGSKELC